MGIKKNRKKNNELSFPDLHQSKLWGGQKRYVLINIRDN